MSYNKLFELVDDKAKSLITNLSSGYMDTPFIINETLKILEDSSPYINILSDNNKISLSKMISSYFKSCLPIFIDNIDFDGLLKFGKMEVYKIKAHHGIRYATEKEVAQGVRGLIPEYIYPIGEEEYKKLCLLYWTISGRNYYFRQAGYTLEYDELGKCKNTFYSMILMCANDLKTLIEELDDSDKFEDNIKKLKKTKSNKGYKYASYEKDEITEDITIKQLIYNIYTVFPRNSNVKEYRRALALAIKSHTKRVQLTPLEISELRDTYYKHALDVNSNRLSQENQNDKIRAMCNRLLAARDSGKINKDHFAYVIINTLKKSNYIKCSPKQYSILESAIKLIDKDDNVENTPEFMSGDDIDKSLNEISDAIGNGLFDD